MDQYAVPYNHRLMDSTLEEIISFIKPIEEDKLKRKNTIDELSVLLQSMSGLKDAVVKPFGSFVSNIYTKWADLDISIELGKSTVGSIGKSKKQKLLYQLMKALRNTGIGCCFEYIPNARVPLLKYRSSYQNISCDVSIGNSMGPLKSKFFLWITQMEWRFSPLILLIKEWAIAQNINDPKCGTLNSLSLCLLVIFHFQTCEPPILPPLKEIFEFTSFCDVTAGRLFHTEKFIEDTCIAKLREFKSSNKISLPELLYSFFRKFSDLQTLASHYAICTYTGKLETKSSQNQWIERSYSLVIEDPFEQPENAARAVGQIELDKISSAFLSSSVNALSSQKAQLLSFLVRPFIMRQIRINYGTQLQHNGSGIGQNFRHRDGTQLEPASSSHSYPNRRAN